MKMNEVMRMLWAPEGEGSPDAAPMNAGDMYASDPQPEPTPEVEEPKVEGDAAAKDDTEAAPFEVSAPEGMEQYADAFAGYNTAATTFLSKNPNATAADALKWAAEYQSGQVGAQTEMLQGQFRDMVQGWEAEARADKEIGGANFEASVETAKAGLDAVGTPELKEYLEQSGAGSNPHVIRAFVKIGKIVKEAPVLGGTGGKGESSFANSLYGKGQ